MAADTSLQRFTRLHSNILDLVIGGERDPDEVAKVLQVVKEERQFLCRLGLAESPPVISDPEAEAVSFTVDDWLKFYRDECGIVVAEGDIVLPPPPSFPHWVVVEPAEFTPNQGYAAMDRRFMCWCYTDDLDSVKRIIPFKGVRVYFVRARIEADEELKNRSADNLAKARIPCMTLQSREALECLFFGKTGNHLDRKNVTRCAGSRSRIGDVPGVYWDRSDGREDVISWRSDGMQEDARVREQFPA